MFSTSPNNGIQLIMTRCESCTYSYYTGYLNSILYLTVCKRFIHPFSDYSSKRWFPRPCDFRSISSTNSEVTNPSPLSPVIV